MAVSSNKRIKSVVRFNPNPAPVTPEQLPDYLFNELNRLGEIIFNQNLFRLEPTHVAPGTTTIGVFKDKPRAGDIRYADGSDWNPGGTGEGIYAYLDNSGSPDWVKLG
jgi:hypothetical protein